MITFMDVFQVGSITKPVRKIILICRLYGVKDRKKKLISRYADYELENSIKLNQLVEKVFGNIYSQKLNKTSDKDKKEVKIVMEDKEEILFKIRKRNKKIDNNKSSRWVVYDICGKDFHD